MSSTFLTFVKVCFWYCLIVTCSSYIETLFFFTDTKGPPVTWRLLDFYLFQFLEMFFLFFLIYLSLSLLFIFLFHSFFQYIFKIMALFCFCFVLPKWKPSWFTMNLSGWIVFMNTCSSDIGTFFTKKKEPHAWCRSYGCLWFITAIVIIFFETGWSS